MSATNQAQAPPKPNFVFPPEKMKLKDQSIYEVRTKNGGTMVALSVIWTLGFMHLQYQNDFYDFKNPSKSLTGFVLILGLLLWSIFIKNSRKIVFDKKKEIATISKRNYKGKLLVRQIPFVHGQYEFVVSKSAIVKMGNPMNQYQLLLYSNPSQQFFKLMESNLIEFIPELFLFAYGYFNEDEVKGIDAHEVHKIEDF